METLYDLLGALPRDDAEGLRTAFRRAVKGTHPDLNPGDPNAGQKFRQIVRAHEILLDGEQRAAYDHLLALARGEAVEHARAGKIHRLASWVMACAGVSAVSIGGLAVVALLWTSTEPAAETDLAADGLGSTKVATVPEPPSPAPTVPAKTADSALPPPAPPLDIAPPSGAIELDHAHGFERAFADVSHARQPEKAARSASARRKGLVAAEGGAKPTPPRQTAANDFSRQESVPFNPRP